VDKESAKDTEDRKCAMFIPDICYSKHSRSSARTLPEFKYLNTSPV
jgi:hypothetical protein